MEYGVYTLGDIDPSQQNFQATAMRLGGLVQEIIAADRAGLDVFGLGEHHRADFAVTAPPIVLAYAAHNTHNIVLSSAVTLLPADNPIRVYQQYATLAILMGGRVELMVGKGAYKEQDYLFRNPGQEDSAEMFDLGLKTLIAINNRELSQYHGPNGTLETIYPTIPRPMTISLATSQNPASIMAAANYGINISLLMTGRPIAEYDAALTLFRHQAQPNAKVTLAAPFFIDEDSQKAKDRFYKIFTEFQMRQGRGCLTRDVYDQAVSPEGSYFVGSTQEVTDKIGKTKALLNPDRLMLQYFTDEDRQGVSYSGNMLFTYGELAHTLRDQGV